MSKKLLIVFVIAFLFRLISLNQSLWLDESITAKVVREFGYSQIIPLFSRFDFHPPLYYFFMKFWSSIFGYSEVALRMPSVIFSLAAGYIVYKIGKLVKNEVTGTWACIFFLFNPLIMYYSQEARMYMMLTCFLAASLYFFLRTMREKDMSLKNILLVNLFFFLSFFSFYGSIFFTSGIFIWLLLKKKYRLFFLIHPGLWLAIFLLAPLLFLQFLNAKTTLTLIPQWSLVLGTVSIKNLLLIPLKFSTGRVSFNPKIVFYILATLWTIIISFFFIRGARRQTIFGFLFFYPIITALIFSFISPLLQYFRFLYLLIVVSIGLSVGADKKVERKIILIGFMSFSLAYLLIPQFHREDWKGASMSLGAKESVYLIPSFADPLLYYRPDIVVKDLRIVNALPSKITVIPYGVSIYGIDYENALHERGLHKVAMKNYHEVTVEEWSRW